MASGFDLGGWWVEPNRNAISRDGAEKHLENRLMQTLVYLAENQGETLSRAQLLDTVWQGLVVNEEALSRAISLLRSALEDDAHNPRFIQTIPGIGYRLIGEVCEHEFPVAEVQDVTIHSTSDGIEPEVDSWVPDKTIDRKKSWYVAPIAIVLLMLAWFTLDRLLMQPARQDSQSESAAATKQAPDLSMAYSANSLAVLPFMNMSSDAEQEFFADGMTEELLNTLAAVPELRVTARTSSFFFKGKHLPVTQIAETLNVKYILEGSVRRSGNKFRITAQLVDAISDRHIWSQTFDRDINDIFVVQDEVATAIVGALVDSLGKLQYRPVSRPESLAAYEAYRAGRLHWWRRTTSDLHRSIELFNRAIEYDPAYAPAHAALADSTMLLVTYGDMHIARGEELADAHIEKALQLDPQSAEAYAALGLTRLIAGRKVEAEAALRKALDLDHSYIPAYVWISQLLSDLGRAPEAGFFLLEAMAMDPLNHMLAINYAYNQQVRGDSQGARQTLQSLLRLQPDHAVLLSALSEVERKSGQLVAAWNAAHHAYALEPENVMVINNMGAAWLDLGDFAAAEQVWKTGIAQNSRSVELKVQYLTMLLIQGRVEDAQDMLDRLFRVDVSTLSAGYQRTYHYFMGLLSGVRKNWSEMREHFELVIDPIEPQLYDREQFFVLTTASVINRETGEIQKAEQQLLTAERVFGHARVNGIDDSDIYYAAASLFALRGENERALQSLQKAYEKGFRQNWKLQSDGRLDPLRDRGEFQELSRIIAADLEQARAEVSNLAVTLYSVPPVEDEPNIPLLATM